MNITSLNYNYITNALNTVVPEVIQTNTNKQNLHIQSILYTSHDTESNISSIMTPSFRQRKLKKNKMKQYLNNYDNKQ